MNIHCFALTQQKETLYNKKKEREQKTWNKKNKELYIRKKKLSKLYKRTDFIKEEQGLYEKTTLKFVSFHLLLKNGKRIIFILFQFV